VLKYIDLFAGCGGLSLGLEAAGCSLILAVEKSPMAAETFYRNIALPGATEDEWRNHESSELPEQAKAGLVVGTVSSLLEDTATMAAIDDIDIVAGGPPCQGFSSAGRRNPEDSRNRLAWEFLDVVEQTSPRAVVIENVLGMNRRFAGSDDTVFAQLKGALAATGTGYIVQGVLANAMHYGAAQHRPRMLLIGLRSDVADARGIAATAEIWKSNFAGNGLSTVPALAPRPTTSESSAPVLIDAIGDLQNEMAANARARSFQSSLRSLAPAALKASGIPRNQEPRRHGERATARFRLYQWLDRQGILRNAMRSVAADGREAAIAVTAQVGGDKYPALAPDGTLLARNPDELVNLLLDLRTRKHSQRVLRWDQPSPTIVTLPDDHVHPTEPRILTVRECARLQGFPDSFTFHGKETTGSMRRRYEVPQYSQVGNAVSPLVGRAVGNVLKEVLQEP